jgi:hypothetical protein
MIVNIGLAKSAPQEIILPKSFNDVTVERFVHVGMSGKYYDIKCRCELSKDSLNSRHRSEYTGKEKELPLVTNWLCSQRAFKKVESLMWIPSHYGKENYIVNLFRERDGKRFVNTWPGFNTHPKQGNIQPWLDLINHLIPEPEYRPHLIDWLAYMLQHPDKKCNWQIIISGIHGAGKDSLFAPMQIILGDSSAVIGGKDMTGDFDDGWTKKKLVIIGELKGLKGNDVETLKLKCTTQGESWALLNPKKESKVMHPNVWAIAVLTNHPDSIKLDETERRFYVLHSPTVWDEALAKHYHNDWLNSGGAEAVFYYLMNRDLSKFDPGTLPIRTTHLNELFIATRSDWESTLEDWYETDDKCFVEKALLPELLVMELRKLDIICNERDVTNWVKAKGYKKSDKRIQLDKGKEKESTKWLCKDWNMFFSEIGNLNAFYKLGDIRKRFNKYNP